MLKDLDFFVNFYSNLNYSLNVHMFPELAVNP